MSSETSVNPPDMVEDAIAYTHRLVLSMEDESGRNVPNHDRLSFDKLEQLSQQLTLASAVAKSLRNKLAPIYKLPPELLARVFYFYVEDAYGLDAPRMSPQPVLVAPMGWGQGAITPPTFTPTTPPLSSPLKSHSYDSRHPNRYLQVTRYFRDTVLSSPHLWTHIRGGVETKYIDLSIERSGCAPLDIDLGTLSEFGGGSYPAMGMGFFNTTTLAGLHNFEHLERIMSSETCARIRSLILDSSRNRYGTNPGVLSVFAHPAPMLESLVVSFALPISEGALPQLFAGHTPSLRKLTISFYATWPGNAFTGLTHLTLLRQDVNGELMPTIPHVLNMLRESPALEELVMHSWGCSPITADDGDEVDSMAVFYPLVQLKSLRIISVGYWMSTLAAKQFMNHLVTPSSTVAYLYSYDLPTPVNPVTGDGDAVEIKFPLRHQIPADFDQFEEGREGAGGLEGEGNAESRSGEERSGADEENGQEDEDGANDGDDENNEGGDNTEAVEMVRQKIYSGEEDSLFEEVRLFQAQNSSMGCTSQTTITSGNVLQYCVTYGNPHLYLPAPFSLAHFTHLHTLWICREFGSSFRLSNWHTFYSGIPQLEKLVTWGVPADTILSPIALLSADGELPHLNHIEVHFAKDLKDLVFSLKLCAQNRIQAGRKLSTVVIASLMSPSEQLQNELETQVSKLVGHLEYKVVHASEEPFIAPMPPPGDDSNRLYFLPL